MAATTVAREAQKKAGHLQNYLIGAVLIPKGVLVSSRVGDGFAYNARTGTATDTFLGVSFETVDNSAGAAGATGIRVEKDGSFAFAMSSPAQTDIGVAVYAADNQTVTKTSTNNQLVGYITEILDAATVRVRINRAVQ